jgi:hypothetical protein
MCKELSAMEIDKHITNIKLDELMDVFNRNKTSENEIAMVAEMVRARFLIPVLMKDTVENGLKKGIEVSYKAVQYESDDTYYAVYTDWR